MGIPVEELILYSKEYNASTAEKVHMEGFVVASR
jgi:hypothetical protein